MVIEHPFIVFAPSGAGISRALEAYADFGYTALAGVTPQQLPAIVELAKAGKPVAIAPQMSPRLSAEELANALNAFQSSLPNAKVLLLSAPDDILIQRYLDSEKEHPFQSGAEAVGLQQAVALEKDWIASVRSIWSTKDYSIDTSTTTPAELRMKIARVLGRPVDNQDFTVYITTFGFKYGIPQDAELMFDMRFMTNPFYDESLRPLTGQDKPVRDFIFNLPQAREFFDRWSVLVAGMLPYYRSEGKTRLTIAVGCTGGKHRSVCMGVALAEHLKTHCPDFVVQLTHRETQRWASVGIPVAPDTSAPCAAGKA